ncbi:MAG: hypothetical protein HDR88_12205 [Bacteroides sp.]|nr:hypothetical protein [Bacteroides sp.]
MSDNKIISHLFHDENIAAGENGWHIQTNDEHCEGVAQLAAEFASEFGMAERRE